MRIQEFPYCCTARVLAGLGPGNTVNYQLPNLTPKTEEILQELKELKQKGIGIVTAITTYSQHLGRKHLEEAGFTTVGPFTSGKHKTKTYLHYIGLYT